MGKRSIAELPVFDFLVIIILGTVVGADIADPEIPHIHTAVAIILIGILHRIVSKLKIKYRKFGHLITFDPTIVIQDGVVYNGVLKKLNLSEYWLKHQLTNLGVKSVSEIFYASVNTKNELHVSLRSFMEGKDDIFPIYH
jgi:uncharacterized membrane protein YcaP (DUF421 family)